MSDRAGRKRARNRRWSPQLIIHCLFCDFLYRDRLSAGIGWWFRKQQGVLDEEPREDFGFILAATLTLLGLIIGFSFSMATSRYDQRTNYEEAEANAFGRNTSGPTYCLPPMRRLVRPLLGTTSTSAFCSIWLRRRRASADQ